MENGSPPSDGKSFCPVKHVTHVSGGLCGYDHLPLALHTRPEHGKRPRRRTIQRAPFSATGVGGGRSNPKRFK